METRHFIKTLKKQKVKTLLSTLIALNVKWVPLFKVYFLHVLHSRKFSVQILFVYKKVTSRKFK